MKNTVIYKYDLRNTDKQVVMLPIGAKILTIQSQYEEPKLWAFVNPDAEIEQRHIEIFGTGHELIYDAGAERNYISTYQLSGEYYVFHAFERIT